jgi:hypothetical protein
MIGPGHVEILIDLGLFPGFLKNIFKKFDPMDVKIVTQYLIDREPPYDI